MRTQILLIAVALCALFSLARAQEAGPTLAAELAQAREAWLLEDDAQAEARASAIASDVRVQGELSRWFASFAASLRLKRGDTTGALAALQPITSRARDARTYFRAVRLLLAFGRADMAESLVKHGRQKHPDSRALARLEADLLLLRDDRDAALAAYCTIISSVASGRYPYELPSVSYWEQVEPWAECGESKVSTDQPTPRDEWRRGRVLAQGKEEPHASLCISPVWYMTDLPGLELCLLECSRDEKRAKQARNQLDALLAEVTKAQDAVDAARTPELRATADNALRLARAKALIEVRIATLYEISKGNGGEAEALAKKGLNASRADVGMMDVFAQALALQGKAEESRRFPLGELNRTAGLSIAIDPGRGPLAVQLYDRAFEAARVLYKANPQAGKAQLEAIRTTFGIGQETTIVEPGNLGLWLILKGDQELGLAYLEEAARLHTADAPGLSANWELAALSLQIQALKKTPKAAPIEGQPAPPNPWLALGQRAGLLLGQGLNVGSYMAGMGNPSLYMNYQEGTLVWAARGSKVGTEFLPALLHDTTALLAANSTPEELDALLADSSAESKQFRTTVDQFATLIDEANANRQNWEAREKAGQRAISVLSAFEARATFIRARFAQQPPANLEDLGKWLTKYQAALDPRRAFKSLPMSDEDVRYNELRTNKKIPEIYHSGLLVDAALALARKGAFAQAGDLLLLNPRPWLDGVSQGRRMQLASLFFRKCGQPEQEFKARMALAAQNNERAAPLALAEFPRARAEILEFGGAADVLDYIAMRYVPTLRGNAITQLIELAPELKTADPVLWFRNTPQDGAAFLYANSVQNGAVSVILENWPKILMTGDPRGTIWRMAIWCLVSDFTLGQRWDDSGMSSTADCIMCWRMLAQVQALIGGPGKLEAERLNALAKRCGGDLQGTDEEELFPEEG
jgi:hypothetical protein